MSGGIDMADSALPLVNEWYQDPQGDYLMVIAMDEDEGLIEAQYFEGEIEEFEIETWNEMEFVSSEPPEDWSGSFDDIERDDLGDTDYPMHPEDWSGPSDEVDRMD
jgi:hypothetical protein